MDSFINLLAFCTRPDDAESWCRSLSTQHDHIMPPEHESIGLPPAKTHDILKPHSNRCPLYLHVCGITEKVRKQKNLVVFYCSNTSINVISYCNVFKISNFMLGAYQFRTKFLAPYLEFQVYRFNKILDIIS